MEGTLIITDNDSSHDHTYYGNGCSKAYGEGGSDKSCSTRITPTYDSENQKTGTYYNFQAATSGVGSTLSAENANSDDTFCPLGWQLPYSGTGGAYYDKSKSWRYLLLQYSLVDHDAQSVIKIRSYPLSYNLPGYYYLGEGKLFNMGNDAIYLSKTNRSADSYRSLYFGWGTNLDSQRAEGKTEATAIRCNSRISTLNPKQN